MVQEIAASALTEYTQNHRLKAQVLHTDSPHGLSHIIEDTTN